MQEASDVASQSGNATTGTTANKVPRTDFFGARHTYHRDADGLYSPPAYMYDEFSSDYGKFLVNGPTQVIHRRNSRIRFEPVRLLSLQPVRFGRQQLSARHKPIHG